MPPAFSRYAMLQKAAATNVPKSGPLQKAGPTNTKIEEGGVKLPLPVLEDDLVEHPVILGLLGIHDVIALDVFFDSLDGLAGMLGDDLVDGRAHPQDFLGVQVNIGGLAAEAA